MSARTARLSDQRMNAFMKRRIISGIILLAASSVLWGITWSIDQSLGHEAFFSGGLLYACLLLLVLLGLRRRLPMLPLMRMATWVQIHIYTGLFALVAFLFHVPHVWADGAFEGTLSWLFLGVAASGVYGLYVSRTAPRRLTAVPGNYRFEQIEWHRDQVADLADSMLEELKATPAARVLAEFYGDTLRPFFSAGPGLAYIAVPTGVRRRRLLSGLGKLDRYLEPDTKKTAGQLAALVRMRDDLDYHFALQLRLRVWVAVHAVLSCGLLMGATVHVLLAIQFAGD